MNDEDDIRASVLAAFDAGATTIPEVCARTNLPRWRVYAAVQRLLVDKEIVARRLSRRRHTYRRRLAVATAVPAE
jgi:predicted transcriptional regulator